MLTINANRTATFDMKTGMLWFDNDTAATLNKKILRASEYYRSKYGRSPTLCYVHPSMLGNDEIPDENGIIFSGKLQVRSAPWVLPNHFFIGTLGDEV